MVHGPNPLVAFFCKQSCMRIQHHSLIYVLSMAALLANAVVATETIWLTKPSIFTILPVTGKKKVSPPLPLLKTYYLRLESPSLSP